MAQDYDLDNSDLKVEEAQKLQKLSRFKEIEDLRAVLATKPGRRFVKRLLERTGIYRTSFTGNSQGYFIEGERNIGLYLIAELSEVDVKAYPQLLIEDLKNDN
jgi:hypothetical protein